MTSLGYSGAFALRANAFTEIDVPGAVDTQPFSINSVGDIAGSWDKGNINTYGNGFVLTKTGQFISIDGPDAAPESALVLGINDWDAIVGALRRYRRSWSRIPGDRKSI